jgi:kynurenine formamidase
MKFIDLTHTISHGMPVFPGEKEPSISRDILPDDVGYVTHRLESNMHTGTHIDAPFHAKSDSLTIDKFPVELFAGSAILIDVCGLSKIKMQPDWEQLFGKYKIVLFYTGYSKHWGIESYYYDYPEFDSEIAEGLVSAGVRIAGFDSPSPDKSPFAFHSIFLKNERFLVENLTNFDQLIGKEDITFMAFPLKIEAEASLIRAVAMVAE